jgi:lipoprotein-releasing system ATP-binding protein
MSDPLVLRDVHRTYRGEADPVSVLRGVDLTLRAGEIVALVAPSGVGKSTLLHIAGLLDRPDHGSVMIEGADTGDLPDNARTAVRRDTIGFVYQFHHLLSEFTALENVALPGMIAGVGRAEAERRATALLAAFGLGHRLRQLPG